MQLFCVMSPSLSTARRNCDLTLQHPKYHNSLGILNGSFPAQILSYFRHPQKTSLVPAFLVTSRRTECLSFRHNQLNSPGLWPPFLAESRSHSRQIEKDLPKAGTAYHTIATTQALNLGNHLAAKQIKDYVAH